MASYYYVKNGGTATGDAGRYATQQTGSFATLGVANYYNDIQDAINATTPPNKGDFINFSDVHVYSQSVNLPYLGKSTNPYFLACVDDVNIDVGRTTGNRGEEQNTATTDVNITDSFISGLRVLSGDLIRFAGSSTLNDCVLGVDAPASNTVSTVGDGVSVTLINTVLQCDDEAATAFILNGGAVAAMYGGGITTNSAGLSRMSAAGFISGGGSLTIVGADLSAVTGTLLADVGGSGGSDDNIVARFDMCKLAAGVAFTNEAFKSKGQRLLATRCSDSSAAAEYQYHLHAFGGDVDDDSAIFRNEDEPFTESNQKISYKIVTNADASLGSPLWLDFPVLRYSKLSAGATDTLRFYLTSNTVLTDKDIYIEVSYPDGTSKQTPNFLTSAPATVGGTLDLMATGTALTTDAASSWAGALSNLYQIDVDTSGDGGADCQPIVKVYVTKPSTTIHIASEFGLN